MILLDTSSLFAALDDTSRWYQECQRILANRDWHPLILSPFVLAELDYMLTTRSTEATQLAVIEDVAQRAYQLERFDESDVGEALEIMRKYPAIGLADASIVVLSNRHRCLDVFTLDQRHFRTLRGHARKPFRLLPFDAN